MEGKKKKELRLREVPIDVYEAVIDKQLKIRKEKGYLVSIDKVVYEIIRLYTNATSGQRSQPSPAGLNGDS